MKKRSKHRCSSRHIDFETGRLETLYRAHSPESINSSTAAATQTRVKSMMANDSNRRALRQRQQRIIILQQHHAFGARISDMHVAFFILDFAFKGLLGVLESSQTLSKLQDPQCRLIYCAL